MTALPATPDLSFPRASAWALACSCLVSQLLAMVDRGFNRSEEAWVALSMVLSALVVGWVSAGVLRARTGRLVVAWLVFGFGLIVVGAGVIDQLPTPSGMTVLELAVSLAQVAALAAFCGSAYFQRQRSSNAQGEVPPIVGLVLVAVVVGGLGGLTAPANGENPPHQLRVGL